jgi:aryl-alcohol dehydrogenase-like predicted oxidoreductase
MDGKGSTIMEQISNSAIERVSLGRTSLRISPLGFGTWQWGDRMFWGYGQGGYSDEDLRAGFLEGISAGIIFFDTAESYGRGHSELLLGRYVHESGKEVVIATKYMPYPWRLSRSDLIKSLRKSLERLGISTVDLYQIHWPFPPRPVEVWAEGLADAFQAGLVRAVGVSNYNSDQMQRSNEVLEHYGIPLASNQVRYNLLDRKPETDGVLKTCKELGVSLIAYSPLAQGMLTGKYTPQNPVSGMRRFQYGNKLASIQSLINTMREIGRAHNDRSPAQVALNWLISKGAVPIPGAKNLRQARENIGAIGWSLSENEVKVLDQASSDG